MSTSISGVTGEKETRNAPAGVFSELKGEREGAEGFLKLNVDPETIAGGSLPQRKKRKRRQQSLNTEHPPNKPK